VEQLILVVHEKNKIFKEKARNEIIQNGATKKKRIIKEFTQAKMATELKITRHRFKIKLDNNGFTEAEMEKLAKLLGCDFIKPSL